MKKEATKKSKLWIWLVVGIAALLAVAGVVLALVLGGGAGKDANGPKGGRAELYWNIDRATYTQSSESGLSTREPGEDGVYRIRYAYNGEVLELPAADKQLVNYIDTMDCMGIVQDADGVIIDVVDPKTIATETARMFYVRKVSGDVITLNSSMAMNGMAMEVPVKDITQIYDVAPNAEVPGKLLSTEDLQPMDSVTVYSNDLGDATHVYVLSHPVESPVYWRADNGMYDSTLKQTKRVPDENGYYTIPFYVNGEYVELKCNIQGIVNTIDNKNRFKAHTGLVLDENGYIVDNMLAATGIRGLLGCEMYDVIEVNGTTFTAENQIAGKMDQYTKTLAADAKIYNVSLEAKPDVRGKAVDTLKVGDRVVVFENTEGEAILVFVAHRLVDGQMYFNVTKKYNSTEKVSTRTPDGNGWYTIDMMDEEGKIKTYKTKDKAIVDKIDSQNNRSVALELDGDVITYVWEGECVAGYSAFVGYSVANVTGSILSIHPSTNPDNISNRIMTADCKVFNMSGKNKGETTTPQIGDYCIMWRNAKSEVNYIYVVRRLVEAPVYFSVTRKWDSTTQQTTRVRDASGYYVYECIRLGGEKVTVKTASKECADFLDSQGPQTFALKVDSNGVIYDYFETVATTGGSKSYLNTIVKRLDVLVLYNPTTEKTYTPKLAEDCKVYNFSTVFNKTRGEVTTLRMDDNIQCYTNTKGEIAIILVRQRKADMKMAWNVNPQYDSKEKKTTRTPGSDGLYSVELAIDGKISTYKVSEAAINYLDSANGAVACTINNGVVVGAQSAIYGPGVWTSTEAAVIATVLEVKGNVLTVKTSKSPDPVKITMNSKFVCYDVSGDAEFKGKAATPVVGDYGRIYLNKDKQAMYFYIQRHGDSTEPLKLYWNVDRQKDDNGSTRQPDKDGWYWIDLAVDGEVKTFKTKSKTTIDYIDKGNGGATALTVKGNEIVAAASALNGDGVAAAGTGGTIKEINGNVVTVYGQVDLDGDGVKEYANIPVKLAANAKVYNAIEGSKTIGQYITLQVGDTMRCYNNSAGEMLHIYVLSSPSYVAEPELPDVPVYDNSNLTFAEGTKQGECTYCGKIVEWTALETITGNTTLADGGHYYLADDITGNTAHYAVDGQKSACVHLNGHSVTSTGRVFAIASDGKLSIMGNGTVTGASTVKSTANVAAATISCRGELNLIGGTYKHVASDLPTIIMSRPQKNMNIYKDVTIEGTEGVTGSNIYNMFGVVNLYGGKIIGGTATPNGTTDGKGGNVYVHGWTGTGGARAEFNMYGGFVDGGIYATKTTESYKVTVGGDAVITDRDGGLTLDHKTGAKLTTAQLSGNAKIYVTGDGAISNATPNAAQYVNNQILPASAEITLKAESNVIIASGLDTSEPEPTPEPVWVMAYMAEPAQYDDVNKVTTRTPDPDGYYYVKLAVNGVVNTYKTTQRGVDGTGNGIDYTDQSANKGRSFVICLTSAESFEFTKAMSAVNHIPNSKKPGTNGTVASIEGNTVTLTNNNTATLADDVQVYDVSVADYGTGFGAATQLAVGDSYMSYADSDGQLTYIFVKSRAAVVVPEPDAVDMNTVAAKADEMAAVFANGGEVEAECPACGVNVTWKPMPAISGSPAVLETGHYYFAEDQIVSSNYYYTINNGDYEVCVHLNGKTFQNTGTGNSRSFFADAGAKLTIMGSGNVIGARAASSSLYRCGSTLEAVGSDTVVNVCGGTWSKTSDALDVMGGRLRGNGALNIYNGTVINIGDVQGNALWAAGGHVNLYGGKINGNVQVMKYAKDTATLQYPVDLNLAGTVVNGKVHYNTENGNELQTTVQGAPVVAELEVNAALPVQIGRLTKGADVKVTATGVFTTANPNMQNYVDDGFLSAKAEGKTITVTDGVASITDAAPKAYDNSNLTFTEGNKAMCPYCGEVKEWTAIEPDGNGTDYSLENGKHYYLANDLLNNTSTINCGVTSACVHLNGHNIQTVGKPAFVLGRNFALNIMGAGNVSGGSSTQAAITSAGDLRLIGGTYTSAAATQPVISHGRANRGVSVYEGATITGNEGVQGSAIKYTFGNFNLYGGTVNGNIYVNGLSGTTKIICNIVINGGTIDGGVQVDNTATSTSFLKISGAPVITAKNGGINFPQPITLERLTKGAEIFVTAADGAFTLENARAADYLEYGYIKAAQSGKTIIEAGGVLSIG